MAPSHSTRLGEISKQSQANLQTQSSELNHRLRALEQENRRLRIKVRNVEHEKERLKMTLQEMIGRASQANRANLEKTHHNHKQQRELNMVTNWWRESEMGNTKLTKNANVLRNQKDEIQDLLDKERNQSRILDLQVQQLHEERKKEKKQHEDLIKDLERQLSIFQRRAMATPCEVPTPRLKTTELHEVCIEMEEEPAKNLQKEENGQNLTSEPQKETSKDLRSHEQEDLSQVKNLELEQVKMLEKTKQCCAVAFIEKLDAQSLNLSVEDFGRYMSGEGSPCGTGGESRRIGAGSGPHADSPALAEAQRQLETLKDLTQRQEKKMIGEEKPMCAMGMGKKKESAEEKPRDSSDHMKVLRYWRSRGFVLEMVDET
ncbi:rab5 GDP/GTP exchange factor [Engraulis encrasicolus]|uniref:rab5 GDP/GTP exchange factor n=1 Tax=Engraulis encrasicolus TaxID=184585 RepID=UPI002FD45194